MGARYPSSITVSRASLQRVWTPIRPIDSPCECEHNKSDSLDARLFPSVVLAVAPAVTMDEASSLSTPSFQLKPVVTSCRSGLMTPSLHLGKQLMGAR